jgi:hypothetical protein
MTVHKFMEFIRRLIEAFRHVRSGGRTTKRTGSGPPRTGRPTRWCDECQRFGPAHDHEDDEHDDEEDER